MAALPHTLNDRGGWLRRQLERSLYRTRTDRPIHRCRFSTPGEVRMMLTMADLSPLLFAPSLAIQVVCTSLAPAPGREEALAGVVRRPGAGYEVLRFDVRAATGREPCRAPGPPSRGARSAAGP